MQTTRTTPSPSASKTKPSVRKATYLPVTFSIAQSKQSRTRIQGATGDPQAPANRSALRFQPMDLRIHPQLTKELEDDTGALTGLLDDPPTLQNAASKATDGRQVPLVAAFVRTETGATRAGVCVQLRRRDDPQILDRTYTDDQGCALLRFPTWFGREKTLPETLIEVAGSNNTEPFQVQWNAGCIWTMADCVVPELPDATGLPVDPFSRIPADFTPDLCDEIASLFGGSTRPLLAGAKGQAGLQSRVSSTIKRFAVPRMGDERDNSGGNKRYLVHVRQEWNPLGYNLGTIQGVEALGPGQTGPRKIQDKDARWSFSAPISPVGGTVPGIHASGSDRIDALVAWAAASCTDHDVGNHFCTEAGGRPNGSLPGPFQVGDPNGVQASIPAARFWPHAPLHTDSDTSVQVNHMLRSAQRRFNHEICTVPAFWNGAMGNPAADSINPLVSRATNLVRWGVFENHAVSTRVEDVVQIRSVPVVEAKDEGDLFTAEEIVEYERFFGPRLMDPALRTHYRSLRRSVDLRNHAGQPLTAVGFTVDYNAVWCGADLRIRVAGQDAVVHLVPGGSRQQAWIHFPLPVLEEELDCAEMELTFRPDRGDAPDLNSPFLDAESVLERSASVEVNRCQVHYQSAPGATVRDAERVTGFRVTNDVHTCHMDLPLEVPEPYVFPETDPLYLHINRNPTYYMGLLLEAALQEPSLRMDARQLRALGQGLERIYRLPIVGFEGGNVLVATPVDKNDNFAKRLRDDPGSGTIIQIACPGSYAEALEGRFQLQEADGKIHPSLQPAPTPAVALVGLDTRGSQDGKRGEATPAPAVASRTARTTLRASNDGSTKVPIANNP